MTRLTNEQLKRKKEEILNQKAKDREDIDFNQISESIEENMKILTEHLDPEFFSNLTSDFFRNIYDIWFRPKFVGFKNMPTRNNPQRPLIFAGNHSGMAFPWDALTLSMGVNKPQGFCDGGLRFLVSPMLSYSSFMSPFQIDNLWRRGGGIDATFENFETLMYQDKFDVIIYPEGVPGIGKGYNKRYQLQEFKTSFIRMSVKYRTEIYLISTVNGEYIDPFAYSSKWVNRMMNYVGIPFMALGPITLLLLLQPWAFYIAFPAQLTYVMGKPIRPFDWINKPYEDISQEEFKEMAKKIRDLAQVELDDAVKKHGKKPYDFVGFFKAIFKNIRKFPSIFPTSWPILFTEFERRYKNGERNIKMKTGGLNILYYLFRNPITIAFFIPILGWIPLIIRGFKNSALKDVDKEKRVIK